MKFWFSWLRKNFPIKWGRVVFYQGKEDTPLLTKHDDLYFFNLRALDFWWDWDYGLNLREKVRLLVDITESYIGLYLELYVGWGSVEVFFYNWETRDFRSNWFQIPVSGKFEPEKIDEPPVSLAEGKILELPILRTPCDVLKFPEELKAKILEEFYTMKSVLLEDALINGVFPLLNNKAISRALSKLHPTTKEALIPYLKRYKDCLPESVLRYLT